MRVTKITVENYRILQNFELDLEKELSLIIGKNNSGKTSLLSILDKFIGRKSTTNTFLWDDFSVSFQKDLKAFVENSSIGEDEKQAFPIGISLNLFLDYGGKHDNTSNVSELMMDLDESNNFVVMEFRYSLSFDMLEALKIDFQKYKAKRKSNTIIQNGDQVGANIECVDNDAAEPNEFFDFIKDEYKKYFKIEKNSRECDPINMRAGSTRKPIENDKVIDKIIHFRSINARRTVSNSETNNALSHFSSDYYQRIEDKENPIQAIEDFKLLIADTDAKLNSIYEKVFGGIIEKIKTFGGLKEGDTDVKILSSLQRRELLKGNTTVKYAHDENHLLPENHNGLGYLNLIGMIFEIEAILAEYRKDGKASEQPADINLLFIEEPEAHTHPQMQYVFINNIKEILETGSTLENGTDAINLQAIISTHSSHIVSESDFDDIKYFYVSNDRYVKSKNLKSLEVEYKKDGEEGMQRFKFLKQYLTLHRSELFFADKAIFIEGDTERILLPAMMEKIDHEDSSNNSLPLLSQFISIIDIGNYSHIFGRFIDFIGIKSLVITDIDPGKPNCEDEAKTKKTTRKKASQKTNETKKPKIIKCKPGEATRTTNASLMHFFSDYIKDHDNVFLALKELPFRERSIEKIAADELYWKSSGQGKIKIAYQVEEENSENEKYIAGSFEDSFFHLNRQFVIDHQEVFQSLKNFGYFDATDKDAWDLAQNCIDKKPSFAIEILLASNDRFSNWVIPKYIQEGLTWLKHN